MGEHHREAGSGRWRRLLVVASIAVPFLLFIAAFLVGAASADGRAWLRVNGYRFEIPVAVARIILVSIGLGFLALICLLIGAGVRDAWRIRPADAPVRDALEADERLLWQGEPRLRTLTWLRALLLSLGLTAPVLFARWIWLSYAGSDKLVQKLFWAFLPTAGLCFWILPALIMGAGPMKRWVMDVFGSVVVTDRRIAWLSPRRRNVYRQIDGEQLIAAMLVEPERGWVAVTRQRGRRVSEIDLFGLPRPQEALTAIEAMMADLAAHRQVPPPA